MLPLNPVIKLFVERVELLILFVYLLRGLAKPKKMTYFGLLAVALCLIIDIWYYHAIRPLVVWGALNTPVFIVATYLIYVKILRKSVFAGLKKLGCVVLMLFR
jgi:hypothetical protein